MDPGPERKNLRESDAPLDDDLDVMSGGEGEKIHRPEMPDYDNDDNDKSSLLSRMITFFRPFPLDE